MTRYKRLPDDILDAYFRTHIALLTSQEPDPRDDLSGTDVARKLTILSRLIPSTPSLPSGYASIPTESLVPPVLADAATKEDYLSRLAEGDEWFDKLREEARAEGKVVRYVGVVDVKEGRVEAKLGK
jgi:homoserine dehydrogenase